jgi:predicted RNase H-like HicB family nuclease
MANLTFTAQIERDKETGLYVGYIPSLPGAHTQAETLDELTNNLIEVTSLCIEQLGIDEIKLLQSDYVGTQQVSVSV